MKGLQRLTALSGGASRSTFSQSHSFNFLAKSRNSNDLNQKQEILKELSTFIKDSPGLETQLQQLQQGGREDFFIVPAGKFLKRLTDNDRCLLLKEYIDAQFAFETGLQQPSNLDVKVVKAQRKSKSKKIKITMQWDNLKEDCNSIQASISDDILALMKNLGKGQDYSEGDLAQELLQKKIISVTLRENTVRAILQDSIGKEISKLIEEIQKNQIRSQEDIEYAKKGLELLQEYSPSSIQNDHQVVLTDDYSDGTWLDKPFMKTAILPVATSTSEYTEQDKTDNELEGNLTITQQYKDQKHKKHKDETFTVHYRKAKTSEEEESKESNQDNEERKLIILFPGNAQLGLHLADTAKYYLDHGIDVVLLDYPGVFEDNNPAKSLDHATKRGVAVYKVMRKMGYQPEDILLDGFSIGGNIATAVCQEVENEDGKYPKLSTTCSPQSMSKVAGQQTVSLIGGAANAILSEPVDHDVAENYSNIPADNKVAFFVDGDPVVPPGATIGYSKEEKTREENHVYRIKSNKGEEHAIEGKTVTYDEGNGEQKEMSLEDLKIGILKGTHSINNILSSSEEYILNLQQLEEHPDFDDIVKFAEEYPNAGAIIGSGRHETVDSWKNKRPKRSFTLYGEKTDHLQNARAKGFEAKECSLQLAFRFFYCILGFIALGGAWMIVELPCAANRHNKVAKAIDSFLMKDSVWRFNNGSQLIFSAYGAIVGAIVLYHLLKITRKLIQRNQSINKLKNSLENTPTKK